MRTLTLVCGIAVLCAASAGQDSASQSAPATQQASATTISPNSQREAARRERMARMAEELAALTKSIPADIDTTNKGLLPKDVVEKLNRIEKLSKQLRKELAAH